MAIQRMDNVSMVVEDLDAAIAFFVELGMELEGRQEMEGPSVERVVGIDGVRTEIAMMRTLDDQGRIELAKYHRPAAIRAVPEITPPNTVGFHRVMFQVDDIRDTVARLQTHGGEVLGDISQYEDIFVLCYLRGPSGIVIGLAEQLQ